jgi:hypothetical protein
LSYSDYFEKYKEIANKVYGFNVERLSKPNIESNDLRIGLIIVNVIRHFLTERNNAVIYVCDNTDSREVIRKRKFDACFTQYDDGSIIKIDGHIVYEDLNIYNAILIHKENVKKNKFIYAFAELNEVERHK